MRTCLTGIEHDRRVVGREQAVGQRGERQFAYGEVCPLDVCFRHPQASEVVMKVKYWPTVRESHTDLLGGDWAR
jgi:hypothetical protein